MSDEVEKPPDLITQEEAIKRLGKVMSLMDACSIVSSSHCWFEMKKGRFCGLLSATLIEEGIERVKKRLAG